ncbi:MFS transporter [Sphingomonas sp. AX6]|uniref:MFS transporter n=1 Tax=Sphingomonas sp. AX6 TaxID=2653171 RepID=UPI0012F0EC18|nr:MFS transporter [Sphingomonas sp. AX6]VXC85266.1 Hexuronate transporter [Sphingomonas sp. AX6]
MATSVPGAGETMTRNRWTVCALLFFATTINYIDRQVIGILKPVLETEFGWSELDYADIVFWFQAAYAIGLLTVGRLIDWVGVRWGYAIAVIVWSIAGMAHAGARTVAGFAIARFALGLGEAGNFPAAVKATGEWFPKKERAFATGIFNAGSNVGAIITPLAVPPIVMAWGWEAAFLITGSLGFVWLIAWLLVYRTPEEHPKVSASELAHIRSDPAESTAKIPWLTLLRYRQTWVFAVAKLMTDPIWWFFLFWLPDFFAKTYDLNLVTFGPPLIAVYLLADVGSVGGGWLSSRLIARGWTVNAGRKTAMLVCALCVVPVSLAIYVDNLIFAVAIIGLAAAGHQGWSANVFTLASDLMPRRATASVVGIGGMAGAIGGMLMAKYVGGVLEEVGNYTPIFVLIGSIYLIALLIVHLISPRLEPADIG